MDTCRNEQILIGSSGRIRSWTIDKPSREATTGGIYGALEASTAPWCPTFAED
jgi:hypothetical protein